jgi:hypothetical protein
MPGRPENRSVIQKTAGFFAANAEAQVRKNRKEAYYTPSNEDGEALHGLIGLKYLILGRARWKSMTAPVAGGGRIQVLRLRATRAWRSARDNGVFLEGFDRAI